MKELEDIKNLNHTDEWTEVEFIDGKFYEKSEGV